MFLEVMGHQVLSRSGVSRIAPQIQADFDYWRKRDLSDLKMLYLFLDAIYLALRQGTKEKEGVLCAYGILENGKKVLLHPASGSCENYEAWLSFLQDMMARGLKLTILAMPASRVGFTIEAPVMISPRRFQERVALSAKFFYHLSRWSLYDKVTPSLGDLVVSLQSLAIIDMNYVCSQGL